MTSLQPPKLATWLLRYLGCGDNNAAVMGELAERYQQGRKAAWYWGQVLITIVVSPFNEVRGRKLLTLRAVLIGWVVLRYVLLPPAALILGGIGDAFAADAWRRGEITPSWCAVITLSLAALSLVGVLNGWIVSYLHDGRRASLMLHAITVLIIWISINPQGEGIGRLLFWLNIMGITVGILIGGLFIARPRNLEGEIA